ncbi:hypothetical protein GC169_02415 [bacterium]|nr:hypothetical protein [bacterium]
MKSSSTLQTLLKIAESRADDLGREAALLQSRRDALAARAAAAAERGSHELQATAGDLDLVSAVSAFRTRLRLEARRLAREIEQADAALADVRGKLSAAFQEQSRFEELIRRLDAEATKARAKRDQALLDEAAVIRSARGG